MDLRKIKQLYDDFNNEMFETVDAEGEELGINLPVNTSNVVTGSTLRENIWSNGI